MKLKLVLIFLFCLFNMILNSITYEIKQDGTSDFTTIQAGINIANTFDTLLVYPGTYYENINYNSKDIIITSLYEQTQNPDYIRDTIIDGNQSGSCIIISQNSYSNTAIMGFTIRNGSGRICSDDGDTSGGGIDLHQAYLTIKDCIIMKNKATIGGGICSRFSLIFLENTTIKNNFAYYSGGGFYIKESIISFDQEKLCNIYFNYACNGSEIYENTEWIPTEVYVDTFTVLEPDRFFIQSTFEYQNNSHVETNILNSKIDPIDADLYVSTDGDNNNSGLSPGSPLKNIYYAQTIIKPDSLNPNTIYLADGIYSQSQSDELFPLTMRNFTSIIGESRENTIIDAEEHCVITNRYGKFNYSIKQLSILNGLDSHESSLGLLYSGYNNLYENRYVNFENILIENMNSEDKSLIFTGNINFNMNDVIITDCTSCSLYPTLGIENDPIEVNITNSIFKNNVRPNSGIFNLGGGSFDYTNFNLINCEITNNHTRIFDIHEKTNLNIVNSTIAENYFPYPYGTITYDGQTLINIGIYNSIFHNNGSRDIYLEYNNYYVDIYNSFFTDGEDGIVANNDQYDNITWYGENLEGNPDFSGENAEYPFMLTAISPCINAGTLNLPEGIELPQYDLAGYPRIYGDGIDMGAYEFQGEPQSTEPDEIVIPKLNKISNYPNPFNPTTNIKLNLSESGRIDFSIYNIRGQKVKTLIDAYSSEGVFEFIWDGNDKYKKQVSSGTYFIKLNVDGVEKTVEKCTLLK